MTDQEMSAADLHEHLEFVASAILEGNVVPVLGAGANLCDRAVDEKWTFGSNLPNGAELAEWLAKKLKCEVDDTADLLRVSQYAGVTRGRGPLYKHLRELFNHDDYPIPSLHRFLAGLPARTEQKGLPRRHQLIVTTNYDDLLERALQEAHEPYDVVRYLAAGPDQGRFVHEPSDADGNSAGDDSAHVIRTPRKYDGISLDRRTVVLKIHGGFDRRSASHDSYVITEDDYIDYLTRTSPNDLIPATLLEQLLNSHFLFLGYAMRDWNLRVLLHRIWGLRDLTWESWAVQRRVGTFDEKMWSRQSVELRQMLLSDYTRELSACVEVAIGQLLDEQRQEAGGAIR
jgi:hypothetical protein